MKFGLTKFKNEEFVVRCENENDFYDFLNKLIDMEIMKSEEIKFMDWNAYKENTCVLYDGEVLYGDFEGDNYTNVVNYKNLIFDANSDIPELRSGMIVETRDGTLYVVTISYEGNKYFMGIENWDSLDNYNDNLKNTVDNLLDIVTIYKPISGIASGSSISLLIDKEKDGIKPIWKREEPKKMTLVQISEALGYDVEVIDE